MSDVHLAFKCYRNEWLCLCWCVYSCDNLTLADDVSQALLWMEGLGLEICYLYVILLYVWMQHLSELLGGDIHSFTPDVQGCSTCLSLTLTTWIRWPEKRSPSLLTSMGCAVWRSSTTSPKLLTGTATGCRCGCTPWGCFSTPTPSNTCSPQVGLESRFISNDLNKNLTYLLKDCIWGCWG